MLPFIARWRAQRQLEAGAARYVARIMAEPAESDVVWLAQNATRGDVDHARWELRYARRALGLLAAERDALDDRTASLVAHALSRGLEQDPGIARDATALAEQQFNARLSAYRDAVTSHAGASSHERLGQTLFAFAGSSFRTPDAQLARASELLTEYFAAAGDALRGAFGTAALPEDIRPSALLSSNH